MPSADLDRVLQIVADAKRPEADPGADLARARAAASARRRRRSRLGLAGLTTVSLLAFGAAAVLDDGLERRDGGTTSAGVELVAEPFEATPYTFDLTPTGWSVQGQRPSAVTIAPDDGSTSGNPDDFRGKLVILFDANRPTGQEFQHEGRAFWVSGDSGYTVMATRTRGDDPAGVVRIQYPDGAGWDRESMVAFLASVHVGPGARHGLG